MTALPANTTRKLGLDTCIGCHACAVACKGWSPAQNTLRRPGNPSAARRPEGRT